MKILRLVHCCLFKLIYLVPLFGLSLGSVSALAAATAPGAVCKKAAHLITGYGQGGAVSYYGGSIFGVGVDDNLVTCPITNGTSMGSDIRFRISVNNNHSSDVFYCQGFARSPNIGQTQMTPLLSAGSGAHTLDATITSLPQGFSTSSAEYWVECVIPRPDGLSFSSISRIRIN